MSLSKDSSKLEYSRTKFYQTRIDDTLKRLGRRRRAHKKIMPAPHSERFQEGLHKPLLAITERPRTLRSIQLGQLQLDQEPASTE